MVMWVRAHFVEHRQPLLSLVGARDLYGISFTRTLIPFIKAPLNDLRLSQSPHLLIPSYLGIRISTDEFCWHKHYHLFLKEIKYHQNTRSLLRIHLAKLFWIQGWGQELWGQSNPESRTIHVFGAHVKLSCFPIIDHCLKHYFCYDHSLCYLRAG